MRTDDLNETQLVAALRELHPVATPSAELQKRVMAMAQATRIELDRRKQRRRRIRLTAQWSSAVALAVIVVLLYPRLALAWTLTRAAFAMQTSSVHFTLYHLRADGTVSSTESLYGTDGKFRRERNGLVEIWQNGKLWRFNPHTNEGEVLAKEKGPDGVSYADLFKQLAFEAILSDFQRHALVTDLGNTRLDGRPVRQIAARQGEEDERMILFFDIKTGLPVQMRIERLNGGGWHLTGYGTLRYGEPLAASLFTPPKGVQARAVDLVKAQAEALSRWQKPLCRVRAGKQEVGIRELVVTGKGELFVVYTDVAPLESAMGMTSTTFEITDDLGSRYVLCHRDIAAKTYPDRQPELIGIDGKSLDVAWFTPLVPLSEGAAPKRFILTLKVPQKIAPPGTTLDTTKYQGDNPYLEANPRVIATVTLPVSARTSLEFPTLYHFSMFNPSSAQNRYSNEMTRLTARRREWRNRKEWEKIVAVTDEWAQISDALAEEAERKNQAPQMWFARYEALRHLNRLEEAKAAKAHALAEDYPNSGVPNELSILEWSLEHSKEYYSPL